MGLAVSRHTREGRRLNSAAVRVKPYQRICTYVEDFDYLVPVISRRGLGFALPVASSLANPGESPQILYLPPDEARARYVPLRDLRASDLYASGDKRLLLLSERGHALHVVESSSPTR